MLLPQLVAAALTVDAGYWICFFQFMFVLFSVTKNQKVLLTRIRQRQGTQHCIHICLEHTSIRNRTLMIKVKTNNVILTQNISFMVIFSNITFSFAKSPLFQQIQWRNEWRCITECQARVPSHVCHTLA